MQPQTPHYSVHVYMCTPSIAMHTLIYENFVIVVGLGHSVSMPGVHLHVVQCPNEGFLSLHIVIITTDTTGLLMSENLIFTL